MSNRNPLVVAPLGLGFAALVGIVFVPLLAISGQSAAAPAATHGIPPRALRAYEATGDWCPGLRWQLVAAIGEVESGHGTHGGASIDDDGVASPAIFGPPLDGSGGNRRLPVDGWLGWWGLAGPWQQAVGPMQFLPGTFTAWAIDGDHDGISNPHDIDDSAATAANYLCAGAAISDERGAVLRYNNSSAYAAEVITLADRLEQQPAFVAGAGWLCPVTEPVSFTDTWHAPRSGGRLHQGVDMFAAHGTPVVAPVAGSVEYRSNSLGGPSFHLWGDDGTYYYGTHLSAYGAATGHVRAGTVIGYVGATGNAAGTAPHLHFEIHPGRRPGDQPSPTNPTPAIASACEDNRVGAALSGGD